MPNFKALGENIGIEKLKQTSFSDADQETILKIFLEEIEEEHKQQFQHQLQKQHQKKQLEIDKGSFSNSNREQTKFTARTFKIKLKLFSDETKRWIEKYEQSGKWPNEETTKMRHLCPLLKILGWNPEGNEV